MLSHDHAECIRPHLIDYDELARVIAAASGYLEPYEGDYRAARAVVERLTETATLRGQAVAYRDISLSTKEIAEQLHLSVGYVRKLLS